MKALWLVVLAFGIAVSGALLDPTLDTSVDPNSVLKAVSSLDNTWVHRIVVALTFAASGWFLGTRSPESKSAMIGALGALVIWSALSYAVWQFYLWNLGREMERAFNQ